MLLSPDAIARLTPYRAAGAPSPCQTGEWPADSMVCQSWGERTRGGEAAMARVAKGNVVQWARTFPRGVIGGIGLTAIRGRPVVVVNVRDPRAFETVRRLAPSSVDGVPVVLAMVGEVRAQFAPSGDAVTDLLTPLLGSTQMTAIVDRLADRLVVLLSTDKALQREVGAAAGGALAEEFAPYFAAACGVIALAAVGVAIVAARKT